MSLQIKENTYIRIGNTIRLIRESKNLTQEYMAYKLGYSDRGSYAKIERGAYKTIDIVLLLYICKLLGCNLVHLMLMAEIDIIEVPLQSYTEFLKQFNLDKENNSTV